MESEDIILEQGYRLWSYLIAIWNYQIVAIDGGGITIGKIVLAVLLVVVGYFLSRRISRQIKKRVLLRFGITHGASSAIESLVFYTLLLFFAFFSLKVANVPLTIFTVLGGAAAIGIGFGSQNIVSNFISGLIMLIEQPIRVGDLIEVDNLMGTVVKIGPRSTVIRSGTNNDIIIPNSSLLEKNVINWTLSDDMIRMKVAIGVAYGSSTRKVEQLLLQSAKSNPKVLSDPAPFVWFVDFADNSLNFELHFWGRMNVIGSRLSLESEIRFEIEALFSKENISIAYPQRDIHIDTMRPLEIKVVGK